MRNSEPKDYIGESLLKVFHAITEGTFGFKDEFIALIDTVRNRNDLYLLCHDFYSYVAAQEKVIKLVS